MFGNSNNNGVTESHILSYVSSILKSYSEIFFVRGRVTGFILLAVSLVNYNTALAGLFSIVVAYTFAYFIGFNRAYLNSGFYTYNPLLVGLAIGYIFQLTGLTLALIAIASVMSFVLAVFLANVFYVHFRLPILSIPFVIVSSIVYLAGGRFTNLYVSGLYTHSMYQDFLFLPPLVNAFFKAMGAIIFMPNVLSGMLISLLILFTSRILFLLAVSGFALGVGVNTVLAGSLVQTLNDVSNFNYILIAIAIGGIFNIPSPKSFAIAAIAVAVSTLLINAVNVFWSLYGIPVFTLPFVVVTLSFIYVLDLVGYPLRPIIFKATPEQTFDHFFTNQKRFSATPITLNLPFFGSWSIWQGFDGRWTHQGIWRHAYDFVICDTAGSTYQGTGKRLEDYYAYLQPVISPVRGRVIKIVSHLPDNPIGSVDNINNWGNSIIIHDERGYFIELSHFSTHSISVVEGQWLESGTQLGLCGNSGYSPQPHIHIQVQSNALMESETLPFTFVQYTQGSQYYCYGLPEENSTVASAFPTPLHEQMSTFILDERLIYKVFKNGQEVETITFVVKMAPDGTFYFSRGDSKLYFGKYSGSFFIYHLEGSDPYLKLLYFAVASMPMHHRIQLNWDDCISNIAFLEGTNKLIASLVSVFIPSKIVTKAQYQYTSESSIVGQISNKFFNIKLHTELILDPYLKFKTIRVDDIEMKRQPINVTETLPLNS